MKLIGAILAGGESRRMGQDKALLPVSESNGGGTLIDFMQRKLEGMGLFDEVIICRSPMGSEPGNGNYLPDINPGLGPVGALHAMAIRYPNASALVVPVDMPMLKAEQLSQLCAVGRGEEEGADSAMDRDTAYYFQGSHFQGRDLRRQYFPLLIRFDMHLVELLTQRVKTCVDDPSANRSVELSIGRLLKDIQAKTIVCQGDASQFANINTVEQWQALKL